jgi:ornithine cyclodeaminase/alanine dehydrogenase-like protein (mu-crystallin family)
MPGSLVSTSLVATRYPRRIVAFGAGSQIEAHLDLFFRSFKSAASCAIVNRTLNERALDLGNKLNDRHTEVDIKLYASAEDGHRSGIEDAVRRADLIICATSAAEPLFPSTWVADGTHVVLVGSYTPKMKEVDGELVQRAARSSASGTCKPVLLVDSKESCMIEAGELLEAKISVEEMTEIGALVPSLQDGTVDEICLGELFQRVQDLPMNEDAQGHTGPVTIFKSVGVGIQDVVIAKAVVEKAEQSGMGHTIMDFD